MHQPMQRGNTPDEKETIQRITHPAHEESNNMASRKVAAKQHSVAKFKTDRFAREAQIAAHCKFEVRS